ECDMAQYAFALMEYNFKLGVSIDASGYSRRNFTGHIRIPQTRITVDDRRLSDQADAYREQVVPALLVGFRRESSDFALSDDKCRLDFTVVDVEVGPNYPPPGVVEVSMSHEVSTDKVYGARWAATLSATYELARDTPRETALKYFLNVAL